jgi:hypothetical protein
MIVMASFVYSTVLPLPASPIMELYTLDSAQRRQQKAQNIARWANSRTPSTSQPALFTAALAEKAQRKSQALAIWTEFVDQRLGPGYDTTIPPEARSEYGDEADIQEVGESQTSPTPPADTLDDGNQANIEANLVNESQKCSTAQVDALDGNAGNIEEVGDSPTVVRESVASPLFLTYFRRTRTHMTI